MKDITFYINKVGGNLMILEKLKFSKCPNCKKHGIPFWKTGWRHNPILVCKYCNEKYKVNIALSIATKVLVPCLLGLILKGIPMPIFVIICVIVILILEYFAPVEELTEDDK